MLSTIHLDNQTLLTTNEIADVTEYRHLPCKLVLVDLPVANTIPEDCFSVRLIGAQPPRYSNRLFVVALNFLPLTGGA